MPTHKQLFWMTIVEQLSIGRVWQEEGERNGDAFRFLNGTDLSLQIPLQYFAIGQCFKINLQFLHCTAARVLRWSSTLSTTAPASRRSNVSNPFMTASKYRLLGCAIEKNFSTMLTAIICYLNNEKKFVSSGKTILSELFHRREKTWRKYPDRCNRCNLKNINNLILH
uniref:Uncharacterized protein n=1 Tax=Heterorhabditis bacteriophora TaxID=37862 RepID=A0A1I7WJZ7_HETBA